MFLGINWMSLTPSLPYLTSAFVIGTIIAGVLGLFQDLHIKGGRLTRTGWVLLGVIVVSGSISLLSGLLGQAVSDKKERDEAAEREERFQRQMSSLSRLQSGMQRSLREQKRLFGKADDNLRLSATLQKQAQGNTLSVLRRVFEESNRISAERIGVSVAYGCEPTDHPYPKHPIMREVNLAVADGKGAQVVLKSVQKIELDDGDIFHGFLGDLGRFETFPAWQKARVSIHLRALPILGTPLDRYAEVRQFEEEQRRLGRDPDALSCFVTARLLLNGRQVLSVSGDLSRGTRGYVAQFDGWKIDSNRLPRFVDR